MDRDEGPNGATEHQRWGLKVATGVDVRNVILSFDQADEALDHVAAGLELIVRDVLLDRPGAVEAGPLPAPNEVIAVRRRSLGRPLVYLPRDIALPRIKGKLIAEQLPDGSILIKVAGDSSSPDQTG